ncbi:MAG: translocation/assembly module TamB domain-containing protein [Candidatus Coatesbacteria bacterium]|nr:translocation/assembly module TamB domain-containing protein [Candidatus Coatesbacteria bacterium]
MKYRFKRIFIYTLILLSVSIGIMFLAVYLLYANGYFSRKLNEIVTDEINKQLNGSIKIKSIGGNLYRTLVFNDIELLNKDKRKIAGIKKAGFTIDLLELIREKARFIVIKDMLIENPDFEIYQYENGSWNFENILKEKKTKTAKSKPYIEIRDAKLNDGRLLFKTNKDLVYDISNLNLNCDFQFLNDNFKVEFRKASFEGNGVRCEIDKSRLYNALKGIKIDATRLMLNGTEELEFSADISRDIIFNVNKADISTETVEKFMPFSLVIKSDRVNMENASIGFIEKEFFLASFIKSEQIVLGEEDFRKVEGRIEFRNNRLEISDLNADYRNAILKKARLDFDFSNSIFSGNTDFEEFSASKFVNIKGLSGKQYGNIYFKTKSFDKDSLSIEFDGNIHGGSIYKQNIHSVTASGTYYPDRIALKRADIRIANSRINASGDISSKKVNLIVRADNIPLQPFTNMNGIASFAGKMLMQGNYLSMEGHGKIKNFDRQGLTIRSIEVPHLNVMNLDIRNPLLSASGELNIRIKDLKQDTYEVSRASIHCALSAGFVQIYDMRMAANIPEKTELIFSGKMNYSRNSYYMESDYLEFIHPKIVVRNNGYQSVSLVNKKIEVARVCLDIMFPKGEKLSENFQQSLCARGYYSLDGTDSDLTITGSKLDIEKVQPFLPITDLAMKGIIDWEAKIKTRNRKNMLDFSFKIENPSIKMRTYTQDEDEEGYDKQDAFNLENTGSLPVSADSLKMSASFEMKYPFQKVSIDKLQVFQKDKISMIKGDLPLSREGNIDLDCDISIVDSDLLSLAGDLFSLYKGKLSYKGSLKGNFSKPEFSGVVSLTDAEIYFRPIGTLLSDLQLRGKLEGSKIVFDGTDKWGRPYDIRAHDEREGRIVLNGFIDFTNFTISDINMDLIASKIFVDIIPDIEAIADIEANLRKKEDQYSLDGSVNLRECFVSIPFGEESKEEYVREAGPLEYNLIINAPQKVWLHNDEADLEMSLDMAMHWQETNMFLLGNLDVIRGTYYLYGTQFKIIEGRLFFTNSTAIDPRMDIKAYTVIPSETSDGQNTTITAYITGTLSKPELRFEVSNEQYEKADMTEQDILTMIALHTTMKEMREKKGYELYKKSLESGITFGSFAASRTLTSKLGLSIFYLKPNFSTERSVSINIGKYLLGSLYLSYSHGLMQSIDRSAELDLILNRNHSLYFNFSKRRDPKETTTILDEYYIGWRIFYRF